MSPTVSGVVARNSFSLNHVKELINVNECELVKALCEFLIAKRVVMERTARLCSSHELDDAFVLPIAQEGATAPVTFVL